MLIFNCRRSLLTSISPKSDFDKKTMFFESAKVQKGPPAPMSICWVPKKKAHQAHHRAHQTHRALKGSIWYDRSEDIFPTIP